jgi:hypothetical protein
MEQTNRRGRPPKNPEAKREKDTKTGQNLAKARKMLERPSDRLTEADHKFIRDCAKQYMARLEKERPGWKSTISGVLFPRPEKDKYIEGYIRVEGLNTFFFMKADADMCQTKGTVEEVAEMIAHQMGTWEDVRRIVLLAAEKFNQAEQSDDILGTA